MRASIPQPFKIPTKSSPNDLLNPYFNRIQSCFSTPVTSRLKPRIWSSYEISQYRKAHEELIVTFKTNSLKTPVVGVSTFTKPLERRLPLSQVITLCESIKAALGDFHLVLFGSSFHDEINYYNNALHILHSTEVITHLNSTNLCGKTPRIESLLVNMLSMDYFISCDSGIGNIVQMLNLPSLIIYGSVYPNSRIFSPRSIPISGVDRCHKFPCHSESPYECTSNLKYSCLTLDPSEIKDSLVSLKLDYYS